ncbi:hypothetical protein BGX27_001704 [Mortierella sp. AM989]|nr:hypothetical protein BGX27_001704 [Mortierella sp. AM989]
MSSDVTMAGASQPQPTAQPQLRIGQRIKVDYARGTVRFLGEVPPTKGEWIGVEWDDKERGKHSGEHSGTRYFNCLFPGTGSFTRPSPKIETGATLLQVLSERYVDKEKDEKDLYLGQSNVKVDVYDFERVKDRQKKLHLMEVVGLANTNVAYAGDYDETQKACPAIKDLDLTATLVSAWQDVAKICAPLTNLDILRARLLTHKRLRKTQFELLEPSMPNLQVLQIGFNMLTELGKTNTDTPIASQKLKGLVHLEDLHLEGNLFSDWNQILRLSHLPKLKSLDLSENKFESIIGPQDDNDFKTLESLRLTDNPLADWVSIDQLGLYTTLRAVWVGDNPVPQAQRNEHASSGFDPRTACIVRMPRVEQLNGSEITMKNSLDAELYYIKHVALSTKGMDDAAIRALHPRFEELCQEITLVSKDNIGGPVKASFKRNVLGTMTVKSLKNLAQKLLRVPSIRQELMFQMNDPDYENVKVDVHMTDDLRQISYYDVKDGEEILVLDKAK